MRVGEELEFQIWADLLKNSTFKHLFTNGQISTGDTLKDATIFVNNLIDPFCDNK
jgi:hypothetical protein